MNYTVEMSDSDGKICRIQLSLPFDKRTTDLGNSTWQAQDLGRLKFRGGGCNVYHGGTNTHNLDICVGREIHCILNDFLDTFSFANDSGDGRILQPICVNFKPGTVSWFLVS